MAVTAVDHVGILVDDLDQAKRFLGGTLGLDLEREADVAPLGLRAAFFRCGPILIEVFEHAADDSPVPRLEGGSRARIDHVAIEVDDVRAAAAGMGEDGVRLRDVGTGEEPLALGGNLNVWTDPATSDGVTYQLIEKGAAGA